MSTFKIKNTLGVQSLKVGTLNSASPGTAITGIFFGVVAGSVGPLAIAAVDSTASIAIPGLKAGGTVFVQFQQQLATDASGMAILSACAGNGNASLVIQATGKTDASLMNFNYFAFNP
jgi:hypothetical protein